MRSRSKKGHEGFSDDAKTTFTLTGHLYGLALIKNTFSRSQAMFSQLIWGASPFVLELVICWNLQNIKITQISYY